MAVSLAPVKENLNDSVTRFMRTDLARLHVNQTVGEALASIRDRPPEGRIIYFYVVDENNQLRGVMPTRRLLLNPLGSQIADIMMKEVISLPNTATVLDACEFFILHRLLAFPVVDEGHRLVGVIDVELYTSELSDLGPTERPDDLFQLIGVHVAEAEQASPVIAFRRRFPWLLCNIGGGILAAFLAGIFEAELQRVVALALFIPVVLALAESVSIQSVSLALQALHGQQPMLRVLLGKLRSEAGTGLLLGVASGLTIGLVALVWIGHWGLVLCLLGGITGGVACAAVIGVAMPNLLRLLKRDPQVAAGPIALAISDMVTLLWYFILARWLLG